MSLGRALKKKKKKKTPALQAMKFIALQNYFCLLFGRDFVNSRSFVVSVES